MGGRREGGTVEGLEGRGAAQPEVAEAESAALSQGGVAGAAAHGGYRCSVQVSARVGGEVAGNILKSRKVGQQCVLTPITLMVINTAWHAHTHAGRPHTLSKLHPLSRVERRCSRACLALPSFPTLGLEKCVQHCSYCTHTRLQGGRTCRAGCVLSQESRGGAAGRAFTP